MVKLQDGKLEKEEARALAMRQRFQERTVRFLNPKQRTIGIDKEFLDRQVEERNRQIALQKENGIQEAMHQQHILAHLEEQERLKVEAALQELQAVNETRLQQVLQPKNNALVEGGPLDLDHCGPSSIQCFGGEDHTYEDRIENQHRQLRQWCTDGMKETKKKYEEELQEKSEYSKYIIEEDQIRCEMAREEERHRQEERKSVMMDNKRLAQERKMKQQELDEADKLRDAEETKAVVTSPFYCEDTDYAKSAVSDHRFRPDHFKRFSDDTLKEIISSNDTVLAEKKSLQEEENARERFWAEKESQMIAQMEEAERQKNLLRQDENKMQTETLMKQCDELKLKQRQMEQDRFGDIGNGFFQKFGTSCR